MKLVGPQLDPHFVQFTTATPRTKKLTFRQRVGLVESSAIRELSAQILSKREALLEEFLKYDPEKIGEIDAMFLKVQQSGSSMARSCLIVEVLGTRSMRWSLS